MTRVGRFEIVGGPVAVWVIGRQDGCRGPECSGSHYHCTHCGAVTSMIGHSDPRDCELAKAASRDNPAWVNA